MKRRRQRLQVSTFPFLAVLLCAMGSLILLLLVIDRRARAVARAKAEQAEARAEAENAKQQSDAKADLERQRQLLHLRLAQQDQELLSRARAVSGQADEAARNVAAEQSHYQDMRARTQDELARLSRRQAEIHARRMALSETAKRDDAAKNELARLTVELQTLEHTLADLKWARQQQQTYSLVPYRGRQGDDRRPLYIECTAHGVVFHPDRLALEGPAFAPGEVRAEVERRIARQRAGAAPGGAPVKKPYALMLVRADGIATYYKALDALQGLKLDYGYEFVERDWLLDFQDDESFARQPWMAEARARGVAPAPRAPLNLSATAPRAAGSPAGNLQGLRALEAAQGPPGTPADQAAQASPVSSGMAGNPGSGAQGEVNALSWPRQRKLGLRFMNDRAGTALAAAGSSGSDVAAGLVGDGPSGGAAGGRNPDSGAGGVGAPGHGRAASDTPTLPGIGVEPPRATDKPPEPDPIPTPDPTPGPELPPGAEAGPESAPSPRPGITERPGHTLSGGANLGAAPSGANAGQAREPGSGGEGLGFVDHAATPNPSQGSFSGAAALPGSASKTGTGSDAGGALPTIAGLTSTPGREAAAPEAERDGHGSAPSLEGPGRHSAEDSGSGSAGGPGLSAIAPMALPASPNRPSVARPGILGANRDWIIPIECRADGVMLVPGRVAFGADRLTDQRADNPLATAVRQLIERRQAGVLAGEPLYRPLIRFLVRPDGLRSYYMAYPLLEALHIPMARISVHPEDDLQRGAVENDP